MDSPLEYPERMQLYWHILTQWDPLQTPTSKTVNNTCVLFIAMKFVVICYSSNRDQHSK